MSDELVKKNRIEMCRTYGIRVGPGIENLYRTSHLSAVFQALFACEEFRIKIMVIASKYSSEPTLALHVHIANLFEHMIVGKQAFLIPRSIASSMPNRFSKFEKPPQYTIEYLLQTLYTNFTQYSKRDSEYFSAAELFLGKFHIQCRACSDTQLLATNFGQNIWTTRIEIPLPIIGGYQELSIQQEINQFANTGYYTYGKVTPCLKCGQINTMVFDWTKPTALVLQLKPIDNCFVRIEEFIIVDNQKYAIFACICFEDILDQYSCYAKIGKMWCYYKSKVAKQIPQLTLLENVCLIFYKKCEHVVIIRELENYLESKQVIPSLTQTPQHSEHLASHESSAVFETRDHSVNDVPIIHGLVNFSGACYMNSILQALFHCNLFREYIMKDGNEDFGDFHLILKLMLYSMQQKITNDVKLWHEIFVYKFTEINKNCGKHSHEFFIHLMQSLNSEVIEFENRKGLNGGQESFEIQVKDKDYANLCSGREDISSNDA